MSSLTIDEAPSVLVADDSTVMRDSLREILTGSGYRVAGEASDGIQVIEQFKRLRPDIVALDLVMPGCSGILALRQILDMAPTTRVLMCSGFGQDSLVAEALNEGATGFLVKPFCPERTLRTLDRVTHRVQGPALMPGLRGPGSARRAVRRATTSARRILQALCAAPEQERSKAA